MFGVCVYSVFVLSYIQVEALRRADHSPKSPTVCKNDHEIEKEARAHGGCRASEKNSNDVIIYATIR
jgi:hypothetical protein